MVVSGCVSIGLMVQKYILDKKVYGYAVVFFLLTVLTHWRLSPDRNILLYGIGAILGLELLEFIEVAVNITPSPFRTVLAQALVAVLTMFVLTSSNIMLGKGVVLFLNLRYLLLQQAELNEKKNLASWGSPVKLILNQEHSLYYQRSLWVFMGFATLIFTFV